MKLKDLPLQLSRLQDSWSSALPRHTPTSPTHWRVRSFTPPSQLAEHSDQSPHSVHTIQRKHGEEHENQFIYINVCVCVPNLYLTNSCLKWVDQHKYLGTFINNCLFDVGDIKRQMIATYAKGNALIHKFRKCTEHNVKLQLLRVSVVTFIVVICSLTTVRLSTVDSMLLITMFLEVARVSIGEREYI